MTGILSTKHLHHTPVLGVPPLVVHQPMGISRSATGMLPRMHCNVLYSPKHSNKTHGHGFADGFSTVVRSSSKGDEGGNDSQGGSGPPSVEQGMSLEEAYGVFGLSTNASYDDVLERKGKLLEECQGDQERAMVVEIAYDVIFSSQLKARLSGDLNVSTSVRFADVKPKAKSTGFANKLQEKVNIPKVPDGLITVTLLDRQEDLLIISGIFATLGVWSVAQGMAMGAQGSASGDIPSLQIAIGLAAAIYFQREKKRSTLQKSVILATIGLIVGTLSGAMLESWLRVDVLPIFGMSSPGTVVGEFSLLGLYLTLCLLA
ncbi:hypothetical protein M9434_006680 [Picochlorum sp. BPE23]|nr:hypothetical protein M9434_006680 [Picochlorum sp. BPE23]